MRTVRNGSVDGVVEHVRPAARAAPVVFDVPHAGRIYPDDFRPAVPRSVLEGGEDRFVDQLMKDAPMHGAHLVVALFARTYIDPNRRDTDIDEALISGAWPVPVEPSAHAALGVGLVFRLIGDALPIYDRRLSCDEVKARIDHYYAPYHACLSNTLDQCHAQNGQVWYVSWHSMSSVGNALSPDPGHQRADFVLGDREGSSCDPGFTAHVAKTLRELGYSVAINDPYQGAELVIKHGAPDVGRHALQVEMRRGLYMSETTLEPHQGFEALRADLGRAAERICAYARGRAAERALSGQPSGR